MVYKLKLNFQPYYGKTWVARIDGKDEKYGFKRKFLSFDKERSYSGKTGMNIYYLDEKGYYEINDPVTRNQPRYFVYFDGEKIEEIPKEKVLEAIL